MTKKIMALIPAAGLGRRSGSQIPKQHRDLMGKTVLHRTLDKLSSLSWLNGIMLGLSPNDNYYNENPWHGNVPCTTFNGGDSRAETVLSGLISLEDKLNADDWIMVHDAARPFVSLADLTRLKDSVFKNNQGGILATPCRDTLKNVSNSVNTKKKIVKGTLSREGVWCAETPQMYPYGALKKAMTTVINNPSVKSKITDECSSMEHIDYESIIVESEDFNMKITYSGDWPLAEAFLKGSAN